MWSAATCRRFPRPRLVAAINKSDRGDESPVTKALTSQRTPNKALPVLAPLMLWPATADWTRRSPLNSDFILLSLAMVLKESTC